MGPVRRPMGLTGLLLDGYDFVSDRCERLGSDVFETRLTVVPVVCMRGPEAGRMFYDGGRFQRHGALPPRILRTLLGSGSVMSLDGAAHHHRKSLLMSVMTPESIGDLAEGTRLGWRDAIGRWERSEVPVELFDEVGRLHCRAVCAWADVPLPEADVDHRTAQLHALVDSPARVGPRHWKGRLARRRLERWAAGLVDRVRGGELTARSGSALHAVATHRDPQGRLLGSEVAAVELLNLLRPVVAIDRFVVFAALALHSHPRWRERLRTGSDTELRWFVQEVRRHYPFFPMTAARVRSAFDWRGVHFPEGRLVLYDLYGTDHDPATWGDPEVFRPERFDGWEPDPFQLVPQGRGDHHDGHRCAGEWVTIALMEIAVTALVRGMDHSVPAQDLRMSHRSMPTLPRSRFVIDRVERLNPAVEGEPGRA